MKEYLNNQMVEKKKNEEIQKKIEHQQLDMWNQENENHFKKEKEINEKVILSLIDCI
jgi:hypothetical protein